MVQRLLVAGAGAAHIQKDINPAEPEEAEKKVSPTDPDSGLFDKGEYERCFAYSAQTACDKHGFVLKQLFHEHFDCYLCLQNQILKYTTTNQEGYREECPAHL